MGQGCQQKGSVYTITHIQRKIIFFFFLRKNSRKFCKQRKRYLFYIAQCVYTCLQNDPIVYGSFLILCFENVQACRNLQIQRKHCKQNTTVKNEGNNGFDQKEN